MWEKCYEALDGHQTGRWQWLNMENAPGSRLYPGWWMFGDRICAPPDVGLCITKDLHNKQMHARMSKR
jgi:hypothetical protein